MEIAAALLTIRKPFGLFSTVISHGWYQTLPFRWKHELGVLQRAERLHDGRVMLVEMAEEKSSTRGHIDVAITVTGEGARDPGIAQEMARRCAVMLHADEDLKGFYRLCAQREELRSAHVHGAGRCMRGFGMTASGIPVIRYRSPERIYEIIAGYEACGIMIANPHVVTLEDGSRYKRVDADQLGFKHEADPMGLLNPGKMRSFVPRL